MKIKQIVKSTQALANIRSFSAKVRVGEKVPPRMKFVDYDSAAGHKSLFVNERDTPEYNPEEEVLIKVEATAVNRADLLQVSFLNSELVTYVLTEPWQVPATVGCQRYHRPRVLGVPGGPKDE